MSTRGLTESNVTDAVSCFVESCGRMPTLLRASFEVLECLGNFSRVSWVSGTPCLEYVAGKVVLELDQQVKSGFVLSAPGVNPLRWRRAGDEVKWPAGGADGSEVGAK